MPNDPKLSSPRAKILLIISNELLTAPRGHMVAIECPDCGFMTTFEQKYPYHAGFSNQGFLYNDAGNLTLVWSSFDPAYEAIIGNRHPWTLSEAEQTLLESALTPAPFGGRWRFENPARCQKCAGPIGGPITQSIYYLKYPGSIDADPGPTARLLADFMSKDDKT